MIVSMGSWITANWKVLSAAGTLLAAGGTAAVNHVQGAEEQFDKIEVQAVRDSAFHATIRQDVSEIKCIVVRQAQDVDALECIE